MTNRPLSIRESKQRTRQYEVDKIYNTLMPELTKDNVVHESVFEKYAILYNQDIRTRLLEGTMDEKEQEQLSILSLEWTKLVDVYKPTHIVDDNGNEVIPTLPPMVMRLEHFKGEEGGKLLAMFDQYHQDGAASPANAAMRDQITQALINQIAASQSQSDVMKHASEFNEMAAKLHKELHGLDIYGKDYGKQVIQPAGNTRQPENMPGESIDFFDYEDE